VFGGSPYRPRFAVCGISAASGEKRAKRGCDVPLTNGFLPFDLPPSPPISLRWTITCLQPPRLIFRAARRVLRSSAFVGGCCWPRRYWGLGLGPLPTTPKPRSTSKELVFIVEGGVESRQQTAHIPFGRGEFACISSGRGELVIGPTSLKRGEGHHVV
jgi:hypothetical protein